MDREETRWHWEEGTKYAIEGMKTLLTLNGGAAVALLAFWGGARTALSPAAKAASVAPIESALWYFGVGALIAAFVFAFAYFTQLLYGNNWWRTAQWMHHFTYLLFLGSAVSFFPGVRMASVAFALA
ncbi:hypothetical protein [Afipia clevelandensis]|uniref:hypothetical protein n=1 Tax=Afipia clevelandensis TaxID=1034 RepID=UPI000590D0F3|nr:hypothetical protein [Afipia clevelandensis]